MTQARQLDTDELTSRVQAMYTQVADEPDHEFHFETGRALALRLGYPVAQLDAIPAGALESFAGVGYFLDLAGSGPGETVLDLGSGSGTDTFLAAALTGPTGRVIGVDMTRAQLSKARRLAASAGVDHVEFREGRIEQPPVMDGSVDCVISNGVVNLAPDKDVVFRAAAAALRPGGRLALADIVTATQLPEGVTCDAALWAACIGGAAQRDHYIAMIETAGFDVEQVRENTQYEFVSDRAVSETSTYGVTSIILRARRTGV
jgi:ubiquinone/menaquinone biosynthesis C-methylase UbiE